ncbi:hypothetical protein [Streptomyces sp. NPDC057002]|uniref:hypothetical protein n=1 Tax=Streptomyces sp. NPDC057002 TaxID=3345992 RepID=UPI00363FCF0D
MALLLAWLVLPLASVLVPVLMMRRVPLRQRKLAWQLCVPVIAGIALGVFGNGAGDQVALAERGEWADVVVVRKDSASINHCDLRMVGGRELSRSLSEGHGCEDWVEAGDKLRVRYDPTNVAGPTADVDRSSNAGFLAAVFGLAVVMGTWGGVRQSRMDRAYTAR